MALGPLCLALVLLVTLLPAGLAFSVLRTANSRATDPREILLSRRNQLGPPLGPWELCALVTCSHATGAAKDACMLPCVNDARKTQKVKRNELQSCIEAKCADATDMDCIYTRCIVAHKRGSKNLEEAKEKERDQSRRQMDWLHSCIERKCAGGDMDCIYGMCVADYKWGPKNLKTRMASDAYDSAKPKRLGGTYGNDKRGGTYGDAKRGDHSSQASAKRSWDDPTAACIEYNCSQHQPSSVEYHLCFSAMCRHR